MIYILIFLFNIKICSGNDNLNFLKDNLKFLHKNVDFLIADRNLIFSFSKYKKKIKLQHINENISQEEKILKIKNEILNNIYSFFQNEFLFDENEYHDILYNIDDNAKYLEMYKLLKTHLQNIQEIYKKKDYIALNKEIKKNREIWIVIFNKIELYMNNKSNFFINASFHFFLFNYKNNIKDNLIFFQILKKFCEKFKNMKIVQTTLEETKIEHIIENLNSSTNSIFIDYKLDSLLLSSFIIKANTLNISLKNFKKNYKSFCNILEKIINLKNPYQFLIDNLNKKFTLYYKLITNELSYILKLYFTFKKYINFLILIKNKLDAAKKNLNQVLCPYNYIFDICKTSDNIYEIIESSEFTDNFLPYFVKNNKLKYQLYKKNFINTIFEIKHILMVFFNFKYDLNVRISKLYELLDRYFLYGDSSIDIFIKNFLYNIQDKILSYYVNTYSNYILSLPYNTNLENLAFFTLLKNDNFIDCLQLKLKTIKLNKDKNIFKKINKPIILMYNHVNLEIFLLFYKIEKFDLNKHKLSSYLIKKHNYLDTIYKFNLFLLK